MMSNASQQAPASASTVVVACKVPAGVELQLCHEEDAVEEVRGERKHYKRFTKGGPIVTANGPAYPVGQTPRGFRSPPQMVGGYALTYNVPKDFFDRWMEQNKLNPVVVNRQLFGGEKVENVRAKAREFRDIVSGLEPLNPEGDARMPRPLAAGVTGVGQADEMAGRPALSPAA